MYFLVRLTGGAKNDWRTSEIVIFEGCDWDSTYHEAGDYAEDYLGYDFPEIELLETFTEEEAEEFSEKNDVLIF